MAPKNTWNNSPGKYGTKVYGKLVRPIPAMYYPPDGTGRDTYIISDNGGTTINYPTGGRNIDFSRNSFLRQGSFETPRMNAFH